MALNTLKCNHPIPLSFKGLTPLSSSKWARLHWICNSCIAMPWVRLFHHLC